MTALTAALRQLHDSDYGLEALKADMADGIKIVDFHLEELLEGRYAAATGRMMGNEWLADDEVQWYKRAAAELNEPAPEFTHTWKCSEGISYKCYCEQIAAWKVIRKAIKGA